MAVSAERLDAVVSDALARGPAERAAFLDAACGDDGALRAEAETLLRLDGATTEFLEGSAIADAVSGLATCSPVALVGEVLDGYRLDALIGSGGMGDVYRAWDVTLERDVAVKVLPRSGFDTPADVAQARAEAVAASRLSHPNIVTVHAVGATDALDFIAMEFVPGATLRARLASLDGPMPVDEALRIALALADALTAAQAAGTVHRDLKPENVMLTPDGRVKVLDFGIAGREAAAIVGPISGTRGYMAPEQVHGRQAQAASDQFALGVMLYEMLARRLPYVGSDEAERSADAPPPTPLRRLNRHVPASFAAVVHRCLALDPGERFPGAADLLAALQAVDLTPRWSRRRLLAGLGAAAAVAGVTMWAAWPPPRRRVMAVLPLRAADGDAESDVLGRGLTATLIERLALMPALSLLPRSLVANFADDTRDARAVAREFGADLVIDGTVRRHGERLVVRAELRDVAAGTLLWSGSYDRPASELLAIEAEIATAIVDDGVGERLDADIRRRLARVPTTDGAAYALYLRAVDLCQHEDEASYLEARDLLREALTRDPRFAAGHAQMATTYAVMAVDGMERPTEAWPESSRHVRAALETDPDLSDAHAAAAALEFFFNWNWEAAEAEWRRALRFGAGELHTDFYSSRALQRWALGRHGDALALVRDARRLDPVTPMYTIREADLWLRGGDAAAAARLYETVLQRRPDDPRALFGLADALHAQRRLDDAVRMRRRAHLAAGDMDVVAPAPDDDAATEWARMETANATAQLAALDARLAVGLYASPLDVARQHARLGRPDAAAGWFERSVADRVPGLTMLDVDTAWNGMRTDSRFLALRARVGLTG